MSLTPKDWKSFQHYKERRPPWIKLHRTLLDNIDFQRLPVASRALAPMLWLLAAEYENGAIAETLEDIAFRLRMSMDELNAALRPLIEKGFFTMEQVASSAPASCKKTFDTKTETEGEIETDTRAKVRTKREPSRFDDFWKEYPRREGGNPRKPAETRFDALVKTGLDPQMLIDEVKKYAAAETSRGNVGSRFIPMASTWLNQQRWSDHAAVAALQGMVEGEIDMDQTVAFYARVGKWSKWAGPEPGQVGCKASAELLAKHGLAPDGRKLEPEPEHA